MSSSSSPVAQQQQALVDRLMQTCGGAYSPETRRKYLSTGPQWARRVRRAGPVPCADSRAPLNFEEVIARIREIGIGYWCTHDTDVIPTEDLGTPRQEEIVGRIKQGSCETMA